MKGFLIICFSILSINSFGQPAAQKAFSEGVRLLKEEKFKDAEKQFEEAIQKGELKDGLKMAHIYRSFCQNGMGKFDEAIVSLNKAIELDPLDAASYIDRGQTYGYKKDHVNALKDFNKVLSIDSVGKQAEAAYYYLGRIKMLQGKNAEAILDFDKLLALVPTDAEAYFLRGTAKSNIMEIDASIADLDQAIKYNPNYMEAYANRGVMKINKMPVKDKVGIIDCIKDPCADLLKAKSMGDDTVEDMIFLYCQKCK